MRIEPHKLHWIWNETNTRLDILAGRVREGVEVLTASDFVRWLNFSGIIQLFIENPSDGVCKVDGYEIQKKVDDLLYECGEWFRVNENSYHPRELEIPRTQMEKVNRRLDQIEEHLSRLVQPESVTVEAGEPVLLVNSGGFSEEKEVASRR